MFCISIFSIACFWSVVWLNMYAHAHSAVDKLCMAYVLHKNAHLLPLIVSVSVRVLYSVHFIVFSRHAQIFFFLFLEYTSIERQDSIEFQQKTKLLGVTFVPMYIHSWICIEQTASWIATNDIFLFFFCFVSYAILCNMHSMHHTIKDHHFPVCCTM